MKLFSRLFRSTPPQPAPVITAPPPPVREPAPPPVDPEEQRRLVSDIASGSVEAAELMRLAVEGRTTSVRQAAANAIHDPAAWQALLPKLKGRDKAAYKSIRQRLDAHLAEQRERARITSEGEALCAGLEKLAVRPHDSLYAGLLSSLVTRWQAMPDSLDPAIRARGQLALDRCHQIVEAFEREQARLAAERAAEEAVKRALEEEERARRQAAEEQAALEARERAAAEEARVVEEQAAASEAAAGEQEEKQATDSQAHAEITSLIRLSGAALGRGDTRKAARFRQSIETAMADAPALPPHVARHLEQLDERLNQLRQWKDFAAAPKRLELIEEVESLIGVDEPPQSLLEHLQALRKEWRTINKGIDVDATAEAERFEQAYKAAFQPCQVYLNEQAIIRRANLEARRSVLERVLAFEAALDPEHPDHSQMARVLREAPQEWRKHFPVDREASRPLDAEFFGALDRLRGKVNTWYAANTADKKAIIARAAQLASAADLPRAIDEVKRLQAEWKTLGPVPHAQSQRLWEEFRAACDAVFARRQQEFAQRAAAFEQVRGAAEALCAQVEEAAQQGPADRPGGEAQVREWREAFDALGELPREHARGLRERFQRAVAGYEAQIAGLAQREARAIEQNVTTAASKVRAYQRAVIQQDPASGELKAAAGEFIQGVPRWPGKGIAQALKQALDRAADGNFHHADDAARERDLRRLCIHAEILSGSPTPPEDAGQRREQELQLLQQGLGAARQADARAWEALRIEWLGMDAVDPAVHDALEQRFLRCLERRSR